jgi:hypothetical protein
MSIKEIIFGKKVEEKPLPTLAEVLIEDAIKITSFEKCLDVMNIAKNTYNKFAEKKDDVRMEQYNQVYNLFRTRAIQLNPFVEVFTDSKLNYISNKN